MNALNQVKLDFENVKKRVNLAQSMKAQGYTREEIEVAIDKISQPDLVDILVAELK